MTYSFEFTCPACGSEMLPIASKRKAPDHTEAEARCDKCLDVWTVTVTCHISQPWPHRRNDPDRLREEAAYHSGVTLEAMNG